MLRFVIQKMRNRKWMVLCLLLGNLLMVSIAAAAPMYSDAALQRTLMNDLSEYMVEENVNPASVLVRTNFLVKSGNSEIEVKRVDSCEQIADQLIRDLDLPVHHRVTQYYRPMLKVLHEYKIDGERDSAEINLSSYSGIEDHIRIISGELYSGELDGNVIDVIVNERTMVVQNLFLGEILEIPGAKNSHGESYQMRIAGVFENAQDQDSYWLNSPSNWNNVCLMDQTLFKQLFVTPEHGKPGYYVDWYATMDYTALDADRTEEILTLLETSRVPFESISGSHGIWFYGEEVLETFLPQARKLNTTVWVLLLPIFVLLTAFIFMVSRQLLEMEQNEISIYKSRGASRLQITMVYVLQSLCIALLSLAGGIPLGKAMCRMLGASNSFLEFVRRTALPVTVNGRSVLTAALAAGFSLLTMVAHAIRYAGIDIVDHKRKKSRVLKMPWWQLVCLDLILLGVSLYGLYQFHGQKALLAEKVMEGASLDPLLYICSSLFMIGSGLLLLRVFPWILRLIFRIGRRWWSPSLYASFLRVIRTRNNQGFLMVFLIMTVAMGMFSAQAARTINANAENRIRYSAGADVVLREQWFGMWEDSGSGVPDGVSAYVEPDFAVYETIPGVAQATKVLVNDDISVKTDSKVVNNVKLMGIHTKEFGEVAWFKEDLLPSHQNEYLNAMSQNAEAILVSSNFRDNFGYDLGDMLKYTDGKGETIRGVIYGFVDYWPSYAPLTYDQSEDGSYREISNYLIIAHLSQIQSCWGVQPYQVWIRTDGSSQGLYDFAQQSSKQFSMFQDTDALLIAQKNDPVFQGTNGILTLGFICILLLCSIGFLIYWVLSIQSRTLQFGIFRAMGMSMGEVFLMLVNEQFWITGISVGAGVGVGVLTSRLFVPLIQIAYSSSDQVIPLETVSEAADYLRLFSVIGVVILLCMVILGVLISKIRIAQALKLGED